MISERSVITSYATSPFRSATSSARSSFGKSAGAISHGLSASTFSPASTEARMRSIFPRLRPESTTTLPGFSRSMRSSKPSPAWTSSRQRVGRSPRALNALTRPR